MTKKKLTAAQLEKLGKHLAKHGGLVAYIYKSQIARFVKWQMPFLVARSMPLRKKRTHK